MLNCVNKLDKNDKNYWQMMGKRQRFADLIWERVYIDADMSWIEIFDYVNSGDFTTDILTTIFSIANSKDLDCDLNENNE